MASSLVLNRRPKVPAQETAAFGAIAERFRRAGALDKAVSLCREGLKKFPDHVSARVTLGWSLLDLGQYEDARVELEQVLRRAPDNLAAIRGLAELHDRFEHTLNLPMDGPGQWPPTAADVEVLSEAPSTGNTAAVPHKARPDAVASAVGTDESPAVMVPADMGMPIWSPVAVAPAAEAPTSASSMDRAADVDTMPGPAMSSASGMSSVREIDFAPSPTPEDRVEESPVAEIDVDLAALIAEAESLEAAAEAAVVLAPEDAEAGLDNAPTVDLLADLDLSADQDLAAQLQLSEDVELATADAAAEADPSVTIELAVPDDASELDALTAAVAPEAFDAAAAVEPAVALEASATVEPEVALQASLIAEPEAPIEASVPSGAEIAVEVAELPEPEAVIEASAPAEPEVVIEASTPAEPEVVSAVSPAAETVGEAAVPVESGAGLEVPSAIEAVAALEVPNEPELANVLAFAPVADAAANSGPRTRSAQSALPALERMLRQVQTRRQQLMAESVA